VNGEIVPIRNSQAIVDAVYKCESRIHEPPRNLSTLKDSLSFSSLCQTLLKHFDGLLET